MSGSITRLLPDRGFGFIRSDDGSEFFFHATTIAHGAFADLHVGDRVTFEATTGPKGPRAEAVERV